MGDIYARFAKNMACCLQSYIFTNSTPIPKGSNSAKNNRKSDLVAAASGGGDCCPHVVDPLFYGAILAGIAAAVYFINIEITMNLRRRKRRKRNAKCDMDDQISCLLGQGKQIISYNSMRNREIPIRIYRRKQ